MDNLGFGILDDIELSHEQILSRYRRLYTPNILYCSGWYPALTECQVIPEKALAKWLKGQLFYQLEKKFLNEIDSNSSNILETYITTPSIVNEDLNIDGQIFCRYLFAECFYFGIERTKRERNEKSILDLVNQFHLFLWQHYLSLFPQINNQKWFNETSPILSKYRLSDFCQDIDLEATKRLVYEDYYQHFDKSKTKAQLSKITNAINRCYHRYQEQLVRSDGFHFTSQNVGGNMIDEECTTQILLCTNEDLCIRQCFKAFAIRARQIQLEVPQMLIDRKYIFNISDLNENNSTLLTIVVFCVGSVLC